MWGYLSGCVLWLDVELCGRVRGRRPFPVGLLVDRPPRPNELIDHTHSNMRTHLHRVKRQRMAGQSGIGEDFKTWKSEAEMVLRQQYD